jgi:hypothetical protein
MLSFLCVFKIFLTSSLTLALSDFVPQLALECISRAVAKNAIMAAGAAKLALICSHSCLTK